MLNEDVTFLFEVDVKVTDRKDLESMLKLFRASDDGFQSSVAEEARRTAVVKRLEQSNRVDAAQVAPLSLLVTGSCAL